MASSADISYENVYLGSWVDQSKGSIKGPTITLTSTGGTILVAFLALFVQYSGQKLWGIVCFVWHQLRVSQRAKTALQYQQDVTLRNNVSPFQSLFYLVQIAWTWRKYYPGLRNSSWWRMAVFPVVVPLSFLILLVASGLLSSYIVGTSNVSILLRGDSCGLWKMPSGSHPLNLNTSYMIENSRYMQKLREFSRIYSRTCYNKTDGHRSPVCQAFSQPFLPYSTALDVNCPFDSSVCILQNTNLRMDTGELSSNEILGINSKTHELKFREVVTCAPLDPDMYTGVVNFTLIGPGETGDPIYAVSWYWGNLTHPKVGRTQVANNFPNAGVAGSYFSNNFGQWQMDTRLNYPDQTSFLPRAEYNISHGDTQVMFLRGNGVYFVQQSDDSWLSAHLRKYDSLNNQTYFTFDHLAHPMGCISQYQFCNSNQKSRPCSALSGILPAAAEAKFQLGLSKTQSNVIDIFINAIYMLNTDVAHALGENPVLLAGETFGNGVQLPLPTNHWVLEMQNAHNIALSMLQRAIVDFARGPGSPAAQEFIEQPNETETKALCSMIRARANGRFSNTSIYGLALVLILGNVIILVNASLVHIVVRIQKWRKIDPWKTDIWFADGLLQLQTSVFAVERDLWKHWQKDVPVIETIGPIDRRDLALGNANPSPASPKPPDVQVTVLPIDSQSSTTGIVTPLDQDNAMSQSTTQEDGENSDSQTSEPHSVPEVVAEHPQPEIVVEQSPVLNQAQPAQTASPVNETVQPVDVEGRATTS